MMPGETVLSGAKRMCDGCQHTLNPQVLFANGFTYIGTKCYCGPNTRESEYYSNGMEAEKDLPAFQAAFDGKGPIPKMARGQGFKPSELTIEMYDPSKGDFLTWLLSD